MSCLCWPCKPKPVPEVKHENKVTTVRATVPIELTLTTMIFKDGVQSISSRVISEEDADTMFRKVNPYAENKTASVGHVRFQSTEQVSLNTALKTPPSRGSIRTLDFGPS